MKKTVGILAAIFIFFAAGELSPVSAEEIILENANISLDTPDGWNIVWTDNAPKETLDLIGINSASMSEDAENFGGCLWGANSNRTFMMYVSTCSDELSEKIFNTESGSYSLISEYLNAPDIHSYLKFERGMQINGVSEKVSLDSCTFYTAEYETVNGSGICYSTVVNGKYISIDFRRVNGSLTDSDRITAVNTAHSAKILNIEEKPALFSTRQIVLLGGIAFLLIALFAGIIIKRKKSF